MGDTPLTIHLIRHGKAAASAEDYDQLRPAGEAQARKLGEALGARAQHFDAIYCGPLRRQIHTLELCRASAGAVGAAWPQETTLPGLAEAPYEELLKVGLLERYPVDPPLQALVKAVQDAGDDQEAMGAAMVATFNHMARLWHDDEFNREGMQTAAEFLAQVDGVLETLVENHDGGDIAVITSNGVIGTMVRRARGDMPSDGAVLTIKNGSVTTLTVRDGKPSVERIGDTSHLPAELVTML